MNLRFLTAVAILVALPRVVPASEPQPTALLVRSAPTTNGPQVEIDVVDRAKIDRDVFVDMIGLRMWCDSVESAQRIRSYVGDPAAALAVKQKLGAKIMEVGVEPDMIPVRGEEGKTLGAENMVLIKGGQYTRPGEYWDASGGGLGDNDKPFRGDKYRVRVSSFFIDKFKVTNEDYCRFLCDGNAGYWTPWNLRIGRAVEGRHRGTFVPADPMLARHPVVLVNWYQARGFTEWAGKRLPTEAEWEFAATGPGGRKYPWGNEPPDETRADYPVAHRHTDPVDAFPAGATPDGVFQMAGNSGEWCVDYFDNASYRKAPPGGVAINPTGAQQPFQPDTWYRYRVMFKGWCKANRPEYFTCTKRNSRPPLADASAGISFRCVKSDGSGSRETSDSERSRVRLLADDTPPLAKAPFTAEQAREFQQRWAERVDKPVVYTNSIGMKLSLLPPGEFTMGRTEEQFDELLKVVDADPEMKKNRGGQIVWSMLMMPAHRVRLTKPFYMGTTEVTVAQFRQFADASGYKTEAEQGLNGGLPYKGGRPMSTWRKPMAWRKNYKQQDDEPVMHLCWNDCVAFCQWLSEKEGAEYTLPTEAEWEYACRAGTTTPWSFGGYDVSEKVASQYASWSNSVQKFQVPQRVALRKPNPFGLYDMHGNMWEYVADWWHRYSYKESPLNDPTGPMQQSEKNDMRRIIRGSSFDWGRWGGDSAYRMRITQRSNQHPHMSFRVALRLKDVAGVPAAVDADVELRRQKRDPGADSAQVVAALKTGALKFAADEKPLPKELTIELSDTVKMEFVLIPAGTFVMGSEQGDKDEMPLHRVVISKPFYMGKHELTQSQWEAVMGKHKWLTELTKGGDHEMIGPTKAMNLLSWNDCQNYIQNLNDKAPGHAFSLPTEAQWEYACRAGSTTEFHFGDDESQLGDYAYFQGNMNWPGQPGFGGKAFYHDVGRKKPNAWGLYDMHGGVWEWCNDRYDARYYLDSSLADPAGPATGRFRVLRGGSWFRYAKYARSAYRKFFHPEGDGDAVTAYINDFGCRLVINLDTREGEAPAESTSSGKSSNTSDPIDYTQLARSLVRRSDKPVITTGSKGQWDDQTLGCITVLDDGQRFFFYSGGARFGKPKNIGMATSTDGIHWTKYDQNPLFPGGMPYAIKTGDTFRLYHPGKDESGRQGLLMRTSKDAFQWSAPELVLGGGILDPCVLQIAEDRFHLYYCAGGQITKDGKQAWEFKTYMATSPDGITWQKVPEPLLPLGPVGSWDDSSHAGPVVLKLGDGFHMWYLGSGQYNGKVAWRIGHATSSDGLNWKKSGDTPVLDVGKPGAWDGGTFMSFDIVYRVGKLLFWYAAAPTGHDDETKMKIQIGHGTSK